MDRGAWRAVSKEQGLIPETHMHRGRENRMDLGDSSCPGCVHLFKKGLQSVCSASGAVQGTRETLVKGTRGSSIKQRSATEPSMYKNLGCLRETVLRK